MGVGVCMQIGKDKGSFLASLELGVKSSTKAVRVVKEAEQQNVVEPEVIKPNTLNLSAFSKIEALSNVTNYNEDIDKGDEDELVNEEFDMDSDEEDEEELDTDSEEGEFDRDSEEEELDMNSDEDDEEFDMDSDEEDDEYDMDSDEEDDEYDMDSDEEDEEFDMDSDETEEYDMGDNEEEYDMNSDDEEEEEFDTDDNEEEEEEEFNMNSDEDTEDFDTDSDGVEEVKHKEVTTSPHSRFSTPPSRFNVPSPSPVQSKPVVTPVIQSKPVVTPTVDKYIASNPKVETETENGNAIYHEGMKFDDFLRKNPLIRSEKDVLKYYSKEEVQYFVRTGKVLLKKGRFIL